METRNTSTVGYPSDSLASCFKMWAWPSVTFSSMGNVTLGKRCFRWVHSCSLGDERRLTGSIVCVITNSAILISAQFHISPHFSFMVQIKSPTDSRPYCEAVRSAILATAWLLVGFRFKTGPAVKYQCRQ